jgi:8-oxo-dGTP diphosphatase
MAPELASFLARHTPRAEETAAWGDGQMHLAISSYLTDELPPLEYVSSVRTLLFRDGELLVVRDPRSTHILPGGRREAGEALEDTLRREVLEETSWELTESALLGFMLFRHLTPRSDGYLHPYPVFLQLVYRARACRLVPEARHAQDADARVQFLPLTAVRPLELPASQRLFLKAAMQR